MLHVCRMFNGAQVLPDTQHLELTGCIQSI